MFSVDTKRAKPAFSNSSALKGVSEKLRLLGGLVWTRPEVNLLQENERSCETRFHDLVLHEDSSSHRVYNGPLQIPYSRIPKISPGG